MKKGFIKLASCLIILHNKALHDPRVTCSRPVSDVVTVHKWPSYDYKLDTYEYNCDTYDYKLGTYEFMLATYYSKQGIFGKEAKT